MAATTLPPWKQLIEDRIIPAFPSPWASHGSDTKFESYIQGALHALDQLKCPDHDVVFLGQPDVWIEDEASLQACKARTRMSRRGLALDEVTAGLVRFFNGMVDWGHPKMAMNVVPPSTLPSIAANLFSAVFSPNLIEEEYSVNVAAAEVEATALAADLAGYDPAQAGGIFTFGGLGTWLYALKVGLTKALGPESRAAGIRRDAQVLTSEVSHFSKVICADWLGLGSDNIREIALNADDSLCVDALREALEACHAAGQPVALINCTTGTTDAFGVDDVQAVVAVRDEFVARHGLGYRPHVHADAVIGWAWMAFRDYDFAANPLGFDDVLKADLESVARKLRHNHLADSIGFDFHKTGYAPYVSSLFLLADGADWELLRRPAGAEAYLFHFGAYNPGEYSLESSRSAAGALAAWANLKYFGIEGYQALLGRLVEAERVIRGLLDGRSDMVVVNPDDHGFVTLYRVYPPGTDARAAYAAELAGEDDAALRRHNTLVHQFSTVINRRQREQRGPFLSFTSNHRTSDSGQPIAALKIFPMTPYADPATMQQIMEALAAAKEELDAELV